MKNEIVMKTILKEENKIDKYNYYVKKIDRIESNRIESNRIQ